MSGTQFWSDHISIGQAVPTTVFPIEQWVAAVKPAVPNVQTVVATAEFPPGCGVRPASPCERRFLPEALFVLKAIVSLHTKERPTEATRIGIALAPAASSIRSSSPTIRRTFAVPRIAYEESVGTRQLHLLWPDHRYCPC
jgi:hypothetical protein